MKRAAITGIAGQDGTYLGRWLLLQGYEVHGLLQFPFDREEPGLRRRFGPEGMEGVRWYNGSLEDPFSLVRFLKAAQPDEIYHLAGLTDSRQSFLVPEETVLAITLGTLRLLEAAREICPAARLFLASSCEVFGEPAQVPQDEATLRQPVTPYGIAKLAADQFARLHRSKYGQFVSVGILYNHESPLRPPNYLSSRVAKAVATIKQGRARELELGDLSAERDWGDARDFVRGFWLALQAASSGDYVFASGRRHRVADLVDCAFAAVGLDYREFVKATDRNQPAQQVAAGLCGDPRKAEQELGWRREWTFEQSVGDLVQAELEGRSEFDRADPAPKRLGRPPPALTPQSP
jgi:GDPmannose 4,6-dehydratase